MSNDTWIPERYEKFRNERSQPLLDLLSMIKPCPDMRAIDLGSGTGEWTRRLHETLGCKETFGLDSSDSMLANSEQYALPNLKFIKGDISKFAEVDSFDLVFSNAALQWVDEHYRLIPRLINALKPGGQVALQLPKNGDHPSQQQAFYLAGENPYCEFPAARIEQNVLPVEQYANLFYQAGLVDIAVQLRVYLHELPGPKSVIEWAEGTLLTHYQSALPDRVYESFFEEYKERVLEKLPKASPYLFTFKRVLLYGRKP